jgi:Carotenoid biosynthesis protein
MQESSLYPTPPRMAAHSAARRTFPGMSYPGIKDLWQHGIMPPFPGIPYGPAPAWCFPTAEFSIFALFLLCLYHTFRRGGRHVAYLFGGVAFGLILEYIEVISDGGYTYGRFLLMLGRTPHDIPVCIGIGWGIILYTARLLSDSLRLGLWTAAAFDTLLALNIDLSMDTVAYRLHMWHWSWNGQPVNPLTAGWFGVPLGNFFGWQMVVFFYSSFSRLFERAILRREHPPIYRVVLTAFVSLLCSLALLFLMELWFEQYMYNHLGISSLDRFLGALVLLLVLAAWGWKKRTAPGKTTLASAIPGVAWWVPGWFHLYFFFAFFACGFFRENPWLTAAACVNLLIGVAIHLAPLSIRSKDATEAAPVTA